MPTDFDTSDPLGLLMAEWAQVSTWFWVFLGAAAVAAGFLPSFTPVVAAAAVGLPILKLGHTVVIVGNELRKETQRPSRENEPGNGA